MQALGELWQRQLVVSVLQGETAAQAESLAQQLEQFEQQRWQAQTEGPRAEAAAAQLVE